MSKNTDAPTVYDQILALFGVRDALLLLAREEFERDIPNNYYLLDYLGKSVGLATSALHLTFSETGSPLGNAGSTPIFHYDDGEGHGFKDPRDSGIKPDLRSAPLPSGPAGDDDDNE